jgi:hypothetical protein
MISRHIKESQLKQEFTKKKEKMKLQIFSIDLRIYGYGYPRH